VPRGFSRRMSVRLALASSDVDAVHRRFAELRATPAQWIVDEQSAWLNFEGFYRDFEVDLALPPLSYCTLEVESLAESEAAANPIGDPAPGGASTLRLVKPVDITDAMLTSSVPETDHPEWLPTTSYAAGARVIKTATHRIYESAAGGNLGNDPADPRQRPGERLGAADCGHVEGIVQTIAVDRHLARPASHHGTRDEADAVDRHRLGAGVAQLVDQVLDRGPVNWPVHGHRDARPDDRVEARVRADRRELVADLAKRYDAAVLVGREGRKVALERGDLLATLVEAGVEVGHEDREVL